ncbi:hypothetical protein G647_08353 [Cladophialophora carrionii CBS 160.54]|uniref:HORMA domain-containing protein n=1 Tax=Cladophialophora carrionii CBS 160.54 TaxID=1279043 RepID=V9D081_9EURO|nr:uncharacterized protein G647_08353 [Cladophialophora carrionii CBS 160.54]ETI20319.1 hypothetical protein G647_08353 [Cladophialophora carrionii CBS 160.54]
MAQQLLLTHPPERLLSQDQSLALAQIFLNAALACIAHTRELIPWTAPCFCTRYIDQIVVDDEQNAKALYSSFQAVAQKAASEGQEVKILVPGGHRRADQILEMLEKGVFDALERGYLEDLQVFVTKSSQGQLSVLENYHFVFAYEQGRVSSVQVNPMNHTFTLENVHKSFKASIRALLRSLRDLPRLPAHRRLGMSLAYNKSCPTLYQPPGFVDKTDFQEGDAEAVCDSLGGGTEDVVGVLESGHYQIRVTVRLADSETQDSSVDLQDTEMSKHLQAMQKTSSSHSNNLLSTLKESTPAIKRRAGAPISESKRAKRTGPQDSQRDIMAGATRASALSRPRSLRNMSFSQLETAGASDSLLDFAAVTQSSPKVVKARLAVTKLAELLVHCYAVQREKTAGGGAIFDRDSLAEGKIKRISRSTNISCECGSPKQSRGMLYCEVCDGWQHRECYGYDETAPVAIAADERFCYTCLLSAGKPTNGESPLSTILLRRAVNYLTTQVKSGSRIGDGFLRTRLNPVRWTKDVFDRVTDRLVEEHLLLRRGPRLFEVRSLKQSELDQIQEKCTGALASIDHLYDVSHGGEDPMKRTTELMQALEAYAHGRDFARAEGCEELVSYDEFGDPVLRWIYRPASSDLPTEAIDNAATATPIRRRKISISRMLINVDYSPSAASVMSMGEPSSIVRDDMPYNTDPSTVESTTTVD